MSLVSPNHALNELIILTLKEGLMEYYCNIKKGGVFIVPSLSLNVLLLTFSSLSP